MSKIISRLQCFCLSCGFVFESCPLADTVRLPKCSVSFLSYLCRNNILRSRQFLVVLVIQVMLLKITEYSSSLDFTVLSVLE